MNMALTARAFRGCEAVWPPAGHTKVERPHCRRQGRFVYCRFAHKNVTIVLE
jgi:hypothetical protein